MTNVPDVRDPIKLLRLQLAAQSLPVDDRTYAMLWTLDPDGTAWCRPLLVEDVAAWVAREWANG